MNKNEIEKLFFSKLSLRILILYTPMNCYQIHILLSEAISIFFFSEFKWIDKYLLFGIHFIYSCRDYHFDTEEGIFNEMLETKTIT